MFIPSSPRAIPNFVVRCDWTFRHFSSFRSVRHTPEVGSQRWLGTSVIRGTVSASVLIFSTLSQVSQYIKFRLTSYRFLR